MRISFLVRVFLIALAVGCVPRLAAPQAPLPSFALIDGFDEDAQYVPSPTSSGIVRTEKQIGRDETPGLFFRGSGVASRARGGVGDRLPGGGAAMSSGLKPSPARRR